MVLSKIFATALTCEGDPEGEVLLSLLAWRMAKMYLA